MELNFMTIKDIVLYSILLGVVFAILRKIGIIGAKRGTKKSAKQKDREQSVLHQRQLTIWMMKQFDSIYNFIGYTSKDQEFEIKYKMDRCGLTVKALERRMKVSELVGIFRLIQFFVILITIVAFSLSLNVLTLVILLGLLIPKAYLFSLQVKIMSEDEELEENFPDLYLLLYSRLIKGSHARIEPTIKDYVNSLNDMYGVGVGHSAIRRFCARFIANVEIYGDESMAVKHMREYYRSPTIINFCNLAIQALSGVDNSDKLLTFKQELAEERRVKMDKRAEALVEKGNKVIFIIYVILFEFIVLSWVSKVDLSMFNMFLGG